MLVEVFYGISHATAFTAKEAASDLIEQFGGAKTARTRGDIHTLYIENADGRRTLHTHFIVCPNPECKKFTLTAALHESKSTPQGREQLLKTLNQWSLIPASASKHFPDYVPQAVRDDYAEALPDP